ncbi:hypothetical protein DFH09DRAFT_1279584 [Mycena vulgaris]|nr:hypothetical protein DFH09DRAFT_1279584 [Mycena vulgaris]
MLSFPLLGGALISWALPTIAQSPPSSWRKPNITTSPTERVSIAGAAIDKAINSLGSDGQFTGEDYIIAGNFYYQMAEFDVVTSGTKYRDALQRYFPLAQSSRGNFTDPLSYGYAAARAYTAYKDPTFLQYAVESWWFGRTYTLSQANVDAGKSTVKNFNVPALCQGKTMAGGTFYTTDTTDPGLNGLATGYFAVLSALLAEATTDNMYLQAATESTDFLRTHLIDSQNVVQDSISGNANDSCLVGSIAEPYNSGFVIEALATLGSITHNASTQALLGTIVQAATVNTAWQGRNGIIANVGHGSGGDIYLVRGLEVAYSRNQSNPSLHAYIEDYLAVQFNAILDLSTSGDSDIYGGPWIGPPSSSFSGGAQTLALSGLIAAISLRNDTAGAGISSSTSASATAASIPGPSASLAPGKSKSPPIGAIVGGVVGGVAILAVFLIIWIIFRRRRYSRATFPPHSPPTMFVGQPATPGPASASVLSASTLIVPSPPVSPQEFNNGKHSRYLSPSTASSSGPPFVVANSTDSTQAALGVLEAGQRNETVPLRSSALPTQELVRLLNQRLQNQEWEEEEAPPGYPTSSTR